MVDTRSRPGRSGSLDRPDGKGLQNLLAGRVAASTFAIRSYTSRSISPPLGVLKLLLQPPRPGRPRPSPCTGAGGPWPRPGRRPGGRPGRPGARPPACAGAGRRPAGGGRGRRRSRTGPAPPRRGRRRRGPGTAGPRARPPRPAATTRTATVSRPAGGSGRRRGPHDGAGRRRACQGLSARLWWTSARSSRPAWR